MSAFIALRQRTAPFHERVDDAFSIFDLADADSYRAFLVAHARALPVAEAIIAAAPALPPTCFRTPLLTADLAALHRPMPECLTFDKPVSDAGAWGVLYVVEGSRLGGGILAKRVAGDLPTAYLSARHQSGDWRAIGQGIDAEAERHDAAWIDEAVTAAEACFDLYARACTG